MLCKGSADLMESTVRVWYLTGCDVTLNQILVTSKGKQPVWQKLPFPCFSGIILLETSKNLKTELVVGKNDAWKEWGSTPRI